MADPPKSAVTASEMLLRIVLLGKSLWDQKDEESPEVAEEMSLFLRNLEDNIQVLNGNTVGLKNSATWALEALQQGLREAAKEAHKILGKGFFDSIWDAKRTFSEVRLLRERVATPFQASLLFVALTVEIKDKDNQDEFNDALLRLQNLLRAQTISSAPAFKDVRKKELQSLWQPVYAEIRDSEPHKIDEAIFYIKATEPQTDDTTDFFVHVLEELEKEKASRAPAPTRAAAPPPSSQTKKTPSTDSLKWYHDPITWDLMCDPVKASDGRTYDRWTFIEHGSSMTRSPFDRREDRPLKVEFDDIDVRGRLFQKFPEQEEEFRSRRRDYRQKALELARKPLGGVEALSMLNHVLTWAEDDAECKAQRDAIQRRYPNLTLEKISRYKQAFTTLDTDSNGRVTLEELGVAFRTMGCYYTPAELQAVVRAAGAEAGANGTIDLPIFLAMMARQNEAVVSSNSGAPALSLEQVARYRDAFSSFDTDGDGSLTIQELGTAMRLLGNNLTQPELRALMSSADADGSGTLDFAEFITLITQAQDAPQQQEETVVTVVLTEAQVAHYTQAFRNFDSDGDGNLNAREMASAMALLGRRISVADAQLAIDAVDLDGNGTLNLVEFLIWMGRHLQQIGAEGAAVNQPHPPPPLSQEELTRYRGVFELYDRNGDGAITFREVASATRLLGYVATDDQLLEEFKEMDTDGNGTLDFQEFVTYLIRQEQDEEPQQQEQGSDAITSHPSFTREQLSAYRDKFDLLDKDRDGIISAGELGTLLRLLGKDPREEDVEDYIALYSNSNGLPGFGFGDFLDLLAQEFVEARSHLSPEQLAEWKANFRLFDRDGDGRISVQELGTVMGALGEKLTQAQLESMIREGDRDGNGTLDFEEFLNLMMATPIS